MKKIHQLVLVLTRQSVSLSRTEGCSKENLSDKKELIQLLEYENYDATILATGSEVEIAIKTSYNFLKEKLKIRVISFPSWELFLNQSKEYQKNTLGNKPIFAIEAGIINGWEKYIPSENFYRY